MAMSNFSDETCTATQRFTTGATPVVTHEPTVHAAAVRATPAR
jgi:hypothetical protein